MRSLLSSFDGAIFEEKVVLRIKADSNGDIYIPTGGYSSDGLANCPYNWNISIDSGATEKYTGTGSSGGAIRVGYGLKGNSVHTVKITPVEDKYERARAFGYNNCQHAPSLINIVSDKSYKAYGSNAICTGNYFRYSQYYGCVNLKSVDEEDLPSTVEIIGNYYRTSQYRDCVKVTSNSPEILHSSIKLIGDYYRSGQYRGCVNATKIHIKANNTASIGAWYRQDQFEGCGTILNPVSLYIDGPTVEYTTTDGLGLIQDNVYRIYVHKDLVDDYRGYSKWDNFKDTKIVSDKDQENKDYEYISIIKKADSSGNITLKTSGTASGGGYSDYDWIVDCNYTSQRYTGTGTSDGVITVGAGTPGEQYRVLIRPYTKEYGWGRALTFNGDTEIVAYLHDSYKAFATGIEASGNYFKRYFFQGATSLLNVEESFCSCNSSIGSYFMYRQYNGCTNLLEAPYEILNSFATIGVSYKKEQFMNCSSLKKHQGLVGYTGTLPTGYKVDMFVGAGDNMDIQILKHETQEKDQKTFTNYYGGTQALWTCDKAGLYYYDGDLVGTSSNTWFDIRIYYITAGGSETLILSDTAPDPGTKHISFSRQMSVGDRIEIRAGYEQRYGRIEKQTITNYNVLGVSKSRFNRILAGVDDYTSYPRNWLDLTLIDYSILYYDYEVIPAVDISKYVLKYSGIVPPEIPEQSGSYGDNRGQAEYNGTHRGIGLASNGNILLPSEWYSSTGIVRGGIGNFRLSGRTLTYVSKTSVSGSSNYDGNIVALSTDYKGATQYITYATTSSGYHDLEYEGRCGISFYKGSGTLPTYSYTGASRDGWWVYYPGYKQLATTRWGNTTKESYTYTQDDWTTLEFSDDGYTAYISKQYGAIKQYSLNTAFDISSKTDTGKTLSLNGTWTISRDKKYLYLWNGTLSIYEYNE